MALTKSFNNLADPTIENGVSRSHWLILVGLFVACGGTATADHTTATTNHKQDATPKRSSEIEFERTKVNRMGELYRELGEGVDAAGADCNRATNHLRQWVAAHQTEIKQLNKELTAIPPEHVEQLAPTLEKAMRRSVLQLHDASTRCQGHRNFYDALSALQL